MAIPATAFPVNSRLYVLADEPASYTSGGTSLGAANSPTVVGYGVQGAPVYKPWKAGNVPTGFRPTGITATLEIVLYERTADVLSLQTNGDSSGTLIGAPTLKPGQLIDYTNAKRLMVRALDANNAYTALRPSFLIPAGVCIGVGPVQWASGGMMREATSLTILALWHDGMNCAYLEGDPADWPVWDSGE